MTDEDEPTSGDKPPADKLKYDQAFFLALAAKGKDTWNAWRRDPENKGVYVTFEGADFSEAPLDQINFEGFEFGHAANFSKCKWRGPEYREIKFGSKAFHPGRAYFLGAEFGDETNFSGTDFGDAAVFTLATFEHVASFNGATFGINPDFSRVTFGDYALFPDAAFRDHADFKGAAFGYLSNFNRAHFSGEVNFSGLSPDRWSSVSFNKRHEDLWERFHSGPDIFLDLSFKDACFDGEATYSGRTFRRTANFNRTRFSYPPDFDGASNVGRIDFTGAHVGFNPPGTRWRQWTTNSEMPVRLRAFRKIAEESKIHDLERDLYIEERKAQRGVYVHRLFEELKRAPITEKPLIFARLLGHGLWIIIMFLYWALANYGRSFMWPLAWLFVSVFIFHFGYALILAPLKQKVDPANKDYYDQAVWMLALGNSVPFVGHLSIDAGIKKSLYCPDNVCGERAPVPPLGIQMLVIVQNVVSIALIFFIGLALRNYFKIK